MNKNLLVIILLLSSWFYSCSKNNQSGTATAIIDSTPLANTIAKNDTINVMAYNVLNYGDGCQGSTNTLDSLFKIIIQYTQPDLLSCEKMAAFNSTRGMAGNLADDILMNVLNTDFPSQYDYATPTNTSSGSKMSVLFFNRKKLTYLKTETLLASISDFDLYKLYYNDINLPITHDTTFLYVVVNHTQSGSSSTIRDQQVATEMSDLRYKFLNFPNLINMGDFNTSGSYEPGYQAVVTSSDSSTIMGDPPYYPDKILTYPGNWDVTPYLVSPFLTTSTRLSASIPNTCGTSGGAKGWYDHIFIAPWLISGKNYIKYISSSYKTIGNDANRMGVDINSTSPVINTSAPANVINALFQFSNKYPVMLKLQVTANRNAISPADPVEKN